MKISIRLILLLAIAGFLLASCEGPMGPTGDAGTDGIDANETCTQCHNNNAKISNKTAQWAESTHSKGGN